MSSSNSSSSSSSSTSSSNFDASSLYTVNRLPQRRSSLRAVSRDFEVTFQDIETHIDKLKEIFGHAITFLIGEMGREMGDDYQQKVRVVLNDPTLGYPIHIPFQEADSFSVDLVLNELDRVLNSNEGFDISSTIKLSVMFVSLPLIGGYKLGGIKNRTVPDILSFLAQKKSIIRVIESEENNCLITALGIAVRRSEVVVKASKLSDKNSQRLECRQMFMSLRSNGLTAELEATFASNSRKWSIAQLEELSKISPLDQFNITLYDRKFFASYLMSFNSPSLTKHIDLLYDSELGHVDVVTSMKGLFNTRYYCYACHTGYSTTKHQCAASMCILCKQAGCTNRSLQSDMERNVDSTKCQNCGYMFKSTSCLSTHLVNGMCSHYVKCSGCAVTVAKRSLNTHVCSKTRCTVCAKLYDRGQKSMHECFVQRPSSKRKGDSTAAAASAYPQAKKSKISPSSTTSAAETQTTTTTPMEEESVEVPEEAIWVFDIETDQSCSHESQHKPVLLIAQSMTGLEKSFYGYRCIHEFCTDVFGDTDRVRKPEWFIAHFGSGFDFLPILDWLYQQQQFIPKIILRGNRVISLKVGNKRFIDSYLFIPIPLRKFSATFEIEEVKKGYFPHFLTCEQTVHLDDDDDETNPSNNRHDHHHRQHCHVFHPPEDCPRGQTTICQQKLWFSLDCSHCTQQDDFFLGEGQFPPLCLFGVSSVKNSELKSLLTWHENQRSNYFSTGQRYNFKKEIVDYCRADVHLLKQGVQKFRSLIRDICSGVDPFQIACTAASSCNYIYRQFFMPENSIAILPINGYRTQDSSSFPANQWLAWIEKRERKKATDSGYEVKFYKSSKYDSSQDCEKNLSAARIGEQKIGPCKVDGLLLMKQNMQHQWVPHSQKACDVYKAIVYEFFGCYYHGCQTCFTNRKDFNKKLGKTMDELWMTTVKDRTLFIQQQIDQKVLHTTVDGYRYIIEDIDVIWECQFRRLVAEHKTNDLSSRYLTDITKISQNFAPLKARDAFVGGRTENFCTRWTKERKNQKFCYVDICSLYPYVNSKCIYPVGHPDKILIAPIFDDNGRSELSLMKRSVSIAAPVCVYCQPFSLVEEKLANGDYFGLVKCLVLPPRDLLIPVLPYKYNAKLFFPLCRSCVNNSTNNPPAEVPTLCEHDNVHERAFWGTFVSIELQLALSKNYRILDVVEIWSWSRDKRSDKLFKGYIDTFLKIKAESSGWPDECGCGAGGGNDDGNSLLLCDHKRAYLSKFELKEGLSLDPQKVKRNDGLRFISKILLNSFWGYLGMRENLPKTRFINNYRDVVNYFTSSTKRVLDATLVGDDLMFLQYQEIDDAADAPRKSNVVLAAFTTAHARSILYDYISKVKHPEQVLYCDTDSIMYVNETNFSIHEDDEITLDIPTGNNLGEMTDELPKNVEILTFYSGGPKFYCLNGQDMVKQTDYNIMKVKGLTLNRAVEKSIDVEKIRGLVENEIQEIRSPFSSLHRSVRRGCIKNGFCEKVTRKTSNKRVFNFTSGKSVPFGYSLNKSCGGGGGGGGGVGRCIVLCNK